MIFKALAGVAIFAAVAAVHAQFFGDATYYEPDGGLGACGAPLLNSDFIVALSADQYADGANCWRQIGVNYQGQFVDATVGDMCPGCDSGSIDLSPAAFEVLADFDAGRIPVSWDFE